MVSAALLAAGNCSAWGGVGSNDCANSAQFVLFQTLRWDQKIDPFHLRVRHRCLAEISRVRSRVLWLLTQVLFDLRQHGRQLLLVVGLLRQRRRYDDLGMTVHRDLRIVSLQDALTMCATNEGPTICFCPM
jgi:hypothetical protein